MRSSLLAEALRKSPAPGGQHSGGSGGSPNCGGLRSQSLQARLIALLHALLALEQAVLCPQHPLLCMLRPQAFRLLRLQLLHALLQPIDAGLPFRALTCKHLALPLLHHLLALLDLLLMLLRALFSLLLSRRPRAHGRWRAWA
ncbi:hypothetical protein GCM10007857_33420 [Bradyrhizobium iriomotense]|uniref:Uncharacterized protein n=1 Tax=Bradyrhizobium iriomotense TaxID=441950 RepID=A0ABQ6B250_9BRAD|nr:hypothetical protein GCM10007857_33420 [Bradyrhizobium iriomotense]